MIEQKGAFGSKKFAQYTEPKTQEKVIAGVVRPNRGRPVRRVTKSIKRRAAHKIEPTAITATIKRPQGLGQRLKTFFTQKKGA